MMNAMGNNPVTTKMLGGNVDEPEGSIPWIIALNKDAIKATTRTFHQLFFIS